MDDAQRSDSLDPTDGWAALSRQLPHRPARNLEELRLDVFTAWQRGADLDECIWRTGRHGGDRLLLLAGVYVHAAAEGVARLQQEALESMAVAVPGLPTGTAPVVRCLYEGTAKGDPARRVMVELHVVTGYESWIRDWSGRRDLPTEFLTDLAGHWLK